MKKQAVIIFIGCLVFLSLVALSVSYVKAQQGATERGDGLPEEATAHSDYIPIQGRLTDTSGNPLDGYYDMDFRIYDVYTGGTALCQDLDNSVAVNDGLFTAYMSMTGCTAFDGRTLYLGIQVGSDAEMTPRTYIDNVPYAYGLRPGAEIRETLGSDAILHIENLSETGRGLRAYAMATTGENFGVVGASRSPDGYGGYFYNNGGGTALWASSDNGSALLATSVEGDGISASSDNGIGVYATSDNDYGLWATSINGTGIHGAGGTGPGVEGFSLLGPGLYGESLSGVAVEANGKITSSEPTYLWISGNDVRQAGHADTTIIDLNSQGGVRIYPGAVISYKNVILPITIAGTLYGQDVRLTALDIYWKGDTDMDSIVTIRLRRATGVCQSCYVEILADTTDYLCWEDTHPSGCTIHNPLATNNLLNVNSGILYLTLELAYSGNTFIDFGGARLTLEYND